jgi:serine/threonine protein kinase
MSTVEVGVDAEVATSLISPGELLLGRYRVHERLAEGGHSVVYRAEDERLRRPACVKLLRLPTRDPAFCAAIEQRFVQEAFLLARLTHPATVKILDFGYIRAAGEADGGAREVPFQVTELVSGGPLSRWVKKRGHLSAAEVVALLTPVARALAEVHDAGVAHLDLKPQNILLARTSSGRDSKLADFGISEMVAGQAREGVRQLLLYSVNWAAPEQMVGDPIGPASDVYSLALVTVFALTGRLVFCEPNPALAYRLRKASCDAIMDAVAGAGLPDDLIDVLVRAIHFEPSLRIGDVMEFLRVVERALWPMIQGRGDGNGRIATFEDSGPSPVGSVVGGDGSPFDRSVADRVTAANLWQLTPGQDCPIIAGRKVSLIQVDDSVDIEASDKIRARISYVRIGDDRTAVHIKGLTCFVSEAGRRPSSALTLESHATVEFISARGEILGRAEVEFAAEGPSRAVVSVAGESLVVDSKVCRNLIALDFGVDAVGGGGGGPAPTCVLLYEIAAV